EILGAERRPDLLNHLSAAMLECLLEAADHLVAKRIVRTNGGDLLVALLASPLSERMARLRARPAGADEIGKLRKIPLCQVVGGRNRCDIDRLARADRCKQIG